MTATKILFSAVFLSLILATSGSCYAAGTAHDIVKVYLASGVGRQHLPTTGAVIDKTQVECPHSVTSCTLALSAMDSVCVRVGGGIREWQIIVMVDGQRVDQQQLWQPGYVNGRSCATGTWQGTYPVAPGPHEVELVTAPLSSVEQGPWSVNYTVTTP
jgi:hypothetical protein